MAVIIHCHPDRSRFWWGSRETLLRYEQSKEEQYRWRFSRAGRRSLNKCVDYLTYLLISATLGIAIFEPLGVCDHTTSAAIGVSIGGIFDMSSVIGHVCFIHGIDTKGGIHKIIWRIVLAFVKKKSSDLGEAIEEGVEHED